MSSSPLHLLTKNIHTDHQLLGFTSSWITGRNSMRFTNNNRIIILVEKGLTRLADNWCCDNHVIFTLIIDIAESPDASATSCDAPPVIPYADISNTSNSGSYQTGSVVTYTCSSGYTDIRGIDGMLTCTFFKSQAEWMGTKLVCKNSWEWRKLVKLFAHKNLIWL